ncbi:MAG TPA: hypothetical protein VGS22_09255 [Thermoanaerobaculia bacterium]|jgi:hypothetical protein|nr:hypothetical protein [Thermoanaerobaculia bacterium]
MSRPRRILLPCLAIVALLVTAPASALPSFTGADSGWARFLEPLFRLSDLFSPSGWDLDPNGLRTPEPAARTGPMGLFTPQGWAIDPNGRVAPPPAESGWDLDPNG